MNTESVKNKVSEIYKRSKLDLPEIDVVTSIEDFENARLPFILNVMHDYYKNKKHSGVWEAIKQTMMRDVGFQMDLHREHALAKYEFEDWKECWSFKDNGGLIYKFRTEETPNGGRILYEWESSSRFKIILDLAEDKEKAKEWRSLLQGFSACFFLKEKAVVLHVDNSI